MSEAEFWQGSLARLVVVGAISGALAGAATDVLLHPVEKIKTRLQSAGAVELLRGAGRLAVLRELFSGCYQVTSFMPMERLILYRPARPPARSLACPPARPAVGAARARRAFMSPFPPVLSGHVSSLLPHYLDTSRPSSRTKWTRLPPRLPGAGASLLPGLLRTVRPRPAPPARHPPPPRHGVHGAAGAPARAWRDVTRVRRYFAAYEPTREFVSRNYFPEELPPPRPLSPYASTYCSSAPPAPGRVVCAPP